MALAAVLLGGGWGVASSPEALAAQTNGSTISGKTVLVLKLDTPEPLDIRTAFLESPPTLTIEFPAHRVTGSLPDRAAIGQGIIQEILTRYEAGVNRQSERFIQGVDIRLNAPYAYHVRSEAGRVVIEITHPPTKNPEAFEVGMSGSTIITSLGAPRLSDRFRAMQEALAKATPSPWTLRWSSSPAPAPGQPEPTPTPRPGATPMKAGRPQADVGRAAPATRRPQGGGAWWQWLIIGGGFLLGVWGAWILQRRGTANWPWPSQPMSGTGSRGSSALALLDQLVWQAFERQGYQMVRTLALAQPPGTLRLIMREGAKTGLLCVGNGPFYEKQTIERFIAVLREANIERGFLVAAGAFTVPAQRLAKEHRIELLGRSELIELLSIGATTEYVSKQLERLQTRLEEARETLHQYAGELDTLRRQRNEASWYLGEERAKAGKLEADLETFRRELRQQHAEIQRWEHEAATLRKHWEESEWYLGESRSRVSHLETQLTALQEAAARAEVAEHEQEELGRAFEDEQLRMAALEAQLRGLQQALTQAEQQAQTWKQELEALKEKLAVSAEPDDRRQFTRRRIPEALVELRQNGQDPLFRGAPRDLSGMGLGLESECEIPAHTSLRVRLMLPGFDPIESKARLIWQRADLDTSRYQSGCRLLGLSPTARRRIDELVKQSSS